MDCVLGRRKSVLDVLLYAFKILELWWLCWSKQMRNSLPFVSAVVTQQQEMMKRPESPLLSQPEDSAPGSSYILHPPLPAVASPATSVSSSVGLPGVHIPLLLNPDILQSTSIPYISPQVRGHICVRLQRFTGLCWVLSYCSCWPFVVPSNDSSVMREEKV